MRKWRFREVKKVTEQIRNRTGVLNQDRSSFYKDEKLKANFLLQTVKMN